VRLAQNIPHLQPWNPKTRGEEQVITLLYNGLMRLDEQLRPQPDLAETLEASADGRTITFTLRSNVTWHNGEPLDALDVQFTLDKMRSLPYTTSALLADLQYISGIAIPDEQTVVLSLTERYAPLLADLALPILPRHLLENRPVGRMNFWDEPVGSGPFKFEQRGRGNSVVLVRNDRYFRGAPLLERVAFVGASDTDITMQALGDGRLLLGEVSWTAARTITSTTTQANLRVGSYPENGFYFLGFNLREGRPFADIQVRRALATAIDLPHLVETVTKGQGIPIASSAVPGSWADLTPVSTQEANLEEARAMLIEAGWTLPSGASIRMKEGKPFQANLYVRNDDMRRIAAAEQIAEVAASIGLDITVVPSDFSTIVALYAPPYDFDLLLGSLINGAGSPDFPDYRYYDPDDFSLFHTSQINQGELDTRITLNFVGFSDPAYDNQVQAARQLYPIEERIEAYQQTQASIARSLPYLYLWVDRIPVVLNEHVTTLDGPVNLSIPNYIWNIERWYLKSVAQQQQ
jgi:peptide/nickel transport system substrate-binding protein